MITSYGFIVFFFGGLGAAFFVHAAWAFYVYQIVYFLHPTSRWWGALVPEFSWSFISACSMLVLVVARRKNYGARCTPVYKLPQMRWLLLLGLWMTVVGFYALNTQMHRDFLIDYWKLIAIVVLAIKLLDSETRLEQALIAYVVGAAYIGWEAYSVGRTGAGRLEGIGMIDAPDANGTAAALAPTLAIIVYLVWQGSMRVRLVALVCGAFVANAIVLINSRGAFLGVGAGLTYLLVVMTFARHRSRGQLLVVLLFVVGGVVATVQVTDQVFWERMSTLKSVEDENTSGSSRIRLWKSSLSVAADHPFGTGVRGFQRLSRSYVDEDMFLNEKSNGKAVHSMWFQSLSEMGWLGPLLLLGMINSCRRGSLVVKRLMKERGEHRAYYRCVVLEAAMISSLVAGTFIDAFRAQVLYWLVLFFAVQYSIYVNIASKEDKGLEVEEETGSTTKRGYCESNSTFRFCLPWAR